MRAKAEITRISSKASERFKIRAKVRLRMRADAVKSNREEDGAWVRAG